MKETYDLLDFLHSNGFECKKRSGDRYFFKSPFRPNERTASFVVRKNYWRDFASGENGSVFDFVMKYNNCEFKEACEILRGNGNIALFDEDDNKWHKDKEASKKFVITDIRKLGDRVLRYYLQSRGVCLKVAYNNIDEVVINGKYRAIGFANDGGGYDVRTNKMKKATKPKTYTSIAGESSTKIVIFEGFMDYLSYLTLKKWTSPKFDVIVLNSVTNTHKIVDICKRYKEVICFYDNDNAGVLHFEMLKEAIPHAVNIMSDEFPEYNDLNDYLMKRV